MVVHAFSPSFWEVKAKGDLIMRILEILLNLGGVIIFGSVLPLLTC